MIKKLFLHDDNEKRTFKIRFNGLFAVIYYSGVVDIGHEEVVYGYVFYLFSIKFGFSTDLSYICVA